MSMVLTKICSICGVEKPLTEFYKNRTKPLGVNAECKVHRKEYHARNRESQNQKVREYQVQNRDNIREWDRNRYRLDLDANREAGAIAYAETAACAWW